MPELTREQKTQGLLYKQDVERFLQDVTSKYGDLFNNTNIVSNDGNDNNKLKSAVPFLANAVKLIQHSLDDFSKVLRQNNNDKTFNANADVILDVVNSHKKEDKTKTNEYMKKRFSEINQDPVKKFTQRVISQLDTITQFIEHTGSVKLRDANTNQPVEIFTELQEKSAKLVNTLNLDKGKEGQIFR